MLIQYCDPSINPIKSSQVRYADFVAAAREVFAYKLRESDRKVLKSDSMDDISRSRAELNKSLNTLTGWCHVGMLPCLSVYIHEDVYRSGLKMGQNYSVPKSYHYTPIPSQISPKDESTPLRRVVR